MSKRKVFAFTTNVVSAIHSGDIEGLTREDHAALLELLVLDWVKDSRMPPVLYLVIGFELAPSTGQRHYHWLIQFSQRVLIGKPTRRIQFMFGCFSNMEPLGERQTDFDYWINYCCGYHPKKTLEEKGHLGHFVYSSVPGHHPIARFASAGLASGVNRRQVVLDVRDAIKSGLRDVELLNHEDSRIAAYASNYLGKVKALRAELILGACGTLRKFKLPAPPVPFDIPEPVKPPPMIASATATAANAAYCVAVSEWHNARREHVVVLQLSKWMFDAFVRPPPDAKSGYHLWLSGEADVGKSFFVHSIARMVNMYLKCADTETWDGYQDGYHDFIYIEEINGKVTSIDTLLRVAQPYPSMLRARYSDVLKQSNVPVVVTSNRRMGEVFSYHSENLTSQWNALKSRFVEVHQTSRVSFEWQ